MTNHFSKVLGNLFAGQPTSPSNLGQHSALNSQLQAAAQQYAQQYAQQHAQAQNQWYGQQNVAGLNHQGYSFPNYNDHVPIWDEGGYEPWIGKPMHRAEFCQRCMFT